MQVENTYLKELLKKLTNIDQTVYGNQLDKDGDIGERFVKDCIKYYFWEKGFKLNDSGNMIYDIEEQVGSNKKRGKRGIDFRFNFKYNIIQHDCFAEAKNWKKQKVSDKKFKSQILDRFINYAKNPNGIRIVTMNKANISEITNNCWIYGIHILPIDKKIVTKELNIKSFTPIMEHFLDDFDYLITVITGRTFSKPTFKPRPKSKPYDEDIILGKPLSYIAKKHGTTESMVSKRKNELSNMGENILDGRSTTALNARYLDGTT